MPRSCFQNLIQREHDSARTGEIALQTFAPSGTSSRLKLQTAFPRRFDHIEQQACDCIFGARPYPAEVPHLHNHLPGTLICLAPETGSPVVRIDTIVSPTRKPGQELGQHGRPASSPLGLFAPTAGWSQRRSELSVAPFGGAGSGAVSDSGRQQKRRSCFCCGRICAVAAPQAAAAVAAQAALAA